MVKVDQIVKEKVIKDPPQYSLLRFFSMVETYPKNATFATQNQDEEIVMVVRHHFSVNLGWIVTGFILFLVPTIFMVVLSFVDATFAQNSILQSDVIKSLDPRILTVFVLFYYSICVSYIIFNYIQWYYDVFIITNERYISIDFDVVEGTSIEDIPLADIVDIEEKVLGFWPAIFGYGSIDFKTISQKFTSMETVPQPTWFRDSLSDLIQYIIKHDAEVTEVNGELEANTLTETNATGAAVTGAPAAAIDPEQSARRQMAQNLEP